MNVPALLTLCVCSIFTEQAHGALEIKNVLVPTVNNLEKYTPQQWAEIIKKLDTPSVDSLPVASAKPQLDSAGKSQVPINSQIIGGSRALRGVYPWQAAVQQDRRYFCGGSLIHASWILTAAHCAKNIRSFVITLGATNQDYPESGSVILTSVKAIVHPQYNPNTISNDVALISLPRAVTLNKFIGLIRLPKVSDAKNMTFAGTNVVISGWGLTKDSGSVTSTLNYVNLVVVSNSECYKTFGSYILPSTLCTSGSGMKGTCGGDSGGPLVYKESDDKYTQIGIVSFGAVSCVRSLPSAYARVTSFLGFISNSTKSIVTFRA